MLAVSRLHATAQGDQILIGIDHDPLGRLGRSRVVLAVVEGHPPPSELFTSANLRPSQSTAHSFFCTPACRRSYRAPFMTKFVSCEDPLPGEIE
jgi:hypothetical protein